MKILNIEVLHCDAGWRPWSFIKITTSDGIIGYSECTDSHGSPTGITGVVEDLKPLLIGKDALEFEKIYWELFSATRQSIGSIIQKALGGIENALLDIKGKHLGVPVYELFGGPIRDKIQLYWSHWGTTRVRAHESTGVKPIHNFHDVSDLVEETKRIGFSAIKTNIILFSSPPKVHMPGFGKALGSPELNITKDILSNTVQYLSTIREAGGNDFDIILDAGFNFKTEGYKQIAKAVEPFNPTWLEIDSYDPKSLREIKDSTSIPICSGEDLYTNRQYKPYFENYSMDIASVDIVWNGFAQSKKIADTADIYEMNITPHNYYSHFATFISAQFAASVPNFRNLEIDIDDVPWKDEITSAVPKVKNGVMDIPKGPGWGIELNEEVIRAHPWKKQ